MLLFRELECRGFLVVAKKKTTFAGSETKSGPALVSSIAGEVLIQLDEESIDNVDALPSFVCTQIHKSLDPTSSTATEAPHLDSPHSRLE